LGNAGRDFERTRHNLGFEVVDFLKGKAEFSRGRGKFLRCDIEISSLSVALLKPTTYMNRSGIAVDGIVGEMGLAPEELLVIADDFNLPLGMIRLRRSGTDGGHNGLASIIYHLESENFPRLRLGIGPVPERIPSEEFVLERFGDKEMPLAEEMVERAAAAVLGWLTEGFDKTASIYNQAPVDN
jgi:PTH1 family peptidyl-tRNA hydrolase